MIEKVKVSVIVPVKNEEKNLAQCLDSLRDFDDVVVVDSGSTDRTGEIAAEYGRQLVQFVWDGKFPKKRNWALRNIEFKHPWVLFLDADERMTAAFAAELLRSLPRTAHNGFWIFYDNWFMGRMLRFGDAMRKLAMVRLGCGEYERVSEDGWSGLDMEIHEHLVVEGSVGVLRARLEHSDRRNLSSYYSKHNEYSSWEANRFLALQGREELKGRQRLKYGLLRCWLFPYIYFMVAYIFKGGFLDGRSGYYFAMSKMFYFMQIQAKVKELTAGYCDN